MRPAAEIEPFVRQNGRSIMAASFNGNLAVVAREVQPGLAIVGSERIEIDERGLRDAVGHAGRDQAAVHRITSK